MREPAGFDVKAELDLSATKLPPTINHIRPSSETCLAAVSLKDGWQTRSTLATWLTGALSFALTYVIGRTGNYGGFGLLTVCVIIALIAATAKHRRSPKTSVVLEIYALGLWFGYEEVFIPYECLQKVEIRFKSRQQHNLYPRQMIFSAQSVSEQRNGRMTKWSLLLPSEEPFLSDTYENILYKVREVAADHAGNALELPTSFVIEGNYI